MRRRSQLPAYVRALAAVLLALAACSHAPPSEEPSPKAVALPSPGMGPIDPVGWKVPGGAYGQERNRCIDRELTRRDLNDYGDARGTTYEGGAPVGVSTLDDRYQYVLRRRPDIGVACTRALGEPDR